MLSLPYNDDHVIECVCDCHHATTVDGKHLNCMTTGRRIYGKAGHLLGLDYCPAEGMTPKWRFVDVMYCDNCNEPFHDIVAWWLNHGVMDYIHEMCGLTRAQQIEAPQLYLCPDCVDKMRQFAEGEEYEQWKAQRIWEQYLSEQESQVDVR